MVKLAAYKINNSRWTKVLATSHCSMVVDPYS